MRLLLIEDHRAMREMVCDHLRKRGYAVDPVAKGGDALAAVATHDYDAVILDLGLPDMDGMDVLRALHGRPVGGLPALILTARDRLEDRIDGLNAGADDYLPKPFALPELEARLRAILRRPGARRSSTLRCGTLAFDPASYTATISDRPFSLTRREAAVLEELLIAAGAVVVRDLLGERLYDSTEDVSANAIEAIVSRLRRKLAALAATVRIETVRGIGYRLVEGGLS